ncbi:MAG: ubiquinone/menaquinone biosynthesis methyltransferase [Chloroflexi bacterium]|nr:ubiquinone/menaquinone biosynthesis methyltransferase [Chloroflexota bacterium]
MRAMFDRVASRYDLVNDVMSLGQHRRWRRFAARVSQPAGTSVLDLATGTGDLAIQFERAGAQLVVGVDFSQSMLLAAQQKFRRKKSGAALELVQADVLRLPFPNESFDRVSSAFLLRNLSDLGAGLAEMRRVLKPAGWVIALEVTHPPSNALGGLAGWWFQQVVPVIGGALSGEWAAYRYLPASLGPLPTAVELATMLRSVGFRNVRFNRLGFGSVTVHIGQV